MSILQSKEKIKHFLKSKDFLLWIEVGTVLFVGCGAFFLGRASMLMSTTTNTPISKRGVHIETKALETSATTSTSIYRKIANEETKNIPASIEEKSISTTGAFVASKSGKNYYRKGCGTINRIKEENRIYFDTEAEAQAHGLIRSKTCK